MEEYKNVKIAKECEPPKEVIDDEAGCKKCPSFTHENEVFLKACNKEIIFVDDSIVYENSDVKDPDKCCEYSREDDTSIEQEKHRKTPPMCFANIPQKISEQIQLPVENLENLCFFESFIINSINKKEECLDIDDVTNEQKTMEIGSACMLIDLLANGHILVFSIEQTFQNNERMLHECLSEVTKDLQLINEKRIERKCRDGEFMHEKSLFIAKITDGYLLHKSVTENDVTEFWKGTVKWTKCGDFLCHGANILLIRKLVLEKYRGCVQSYKCDINGIFALAQHWFHPNEERTIYNRKMFTKRVDQLTIFDNQEIEKVSGFYMERTGRMLKQVCDKKSYFIHMNPLDDPYELQSSQHFHTNWRHDVNMMSRYLEKKARKKEELKENLNKPHVRQVLHQYIENLIKDKPKSVMNFTVEFLRKMEHQHSRPHSPSTIRNSI